jgi:hypothetical protein
MVVDTPRPALRGGSAAPNGQNGGGWPPHNFHFFFEKKKKKKFVGHVAFIFDDMCDGGIKLIFSYNLDTILDRI